MKLKTACIAAALAGYCASALAGAPQTFSDEIILDWKDLRAMLRDDGVDLRVGYVSESATNVQGGPRQSWSYTDQWTFSTMFDLEKLLGLEQARFGLVFTDRNGSNLSADLHTLQLVQEVYGRNQTWRWTEFWYDQRFADGLIDWKIGRMPEGDDFGSFSCDFQNLTFCGAQPGNIVGNYWYNWPVSQWATRVKANLKGFGYVQAGAYEVNPSYLLTRYALDLGSPPGASGVLVPFEIGWLASFGKLSGTYKFGGWYDTSTAADAVDSVSNEFPGEAQPRLHHGRYGAYVSFVQRLTEPDGPESRRGLSVFLNATYADRRTSMLDSQVALGIEYKGLFASRPFDMLGLAVGETHVNSRVGEAERLRNTGFNEPVDVQSSEWSSELFYNIDIGQWLDLRPNVQYIAQPGGVARRTSDVILGFKLMINL
jgi:porin